MDKYIIYTMGNEKMNEAVQEVLFEKGCYRGGGRYKTPEYLYHYAITFDGKGDHFMCLEESQLGLLTENYQELTFRQLCELPVHDDYEELAEKIVVTIRHHLRESKATIAHQSRDWCKVWERMKPKLGL